MIEFKITLRTDTTIPFGNLKEVVEAIMKLGYTCELADNGNIIFDFLENKIKEKAK
jgi:hypothetical protein